MDQETENKINAFAEHLGNVAVDIESTHPQTAKDLNAASKLIQELTLNISLEGMRFHLETKLP